MTAPKSHLIRTIDIERALGPANDQNADPAPDVVIQTQSRDQFQKQFQHALWGCIARGFLVEECFGDIWEETLQEVDLPERMHRELYQELISWAKTVTKVQAPPGWGVPPARPTSKPMKPVDPYQTGAGPELDSLIHHQILGNSPTEVPPCYSTDSGQADKLKQLIEAHYGARFICGRTAMRGKTWFARYEIDPGNPTEVLAETYALAVCRLALLRVERR